MAEAVRTLFVAGSFLFACVTFAEDPPNPPYEIYDLHTDHLGNVRVVTDESGQIVSQHDFLPFGEEITPVFDYNTKRFTGHERDKETGLDYMFARYYGSNLGRFMSPDPLFGHLMIPQSWNMYVYTINNPLKYVDPFGLDFYLVDQDGNKIQGGDACQQDGRCDDDGNLIVTSEELQDEDSEYSGTVDENGVQITGVEGAAAEGTYTGQFISDTQAATLEGSGAFEGLTFNVDGNAGGKALASGTFSVSAGGRTLENRGGFKSWETWFGYDRFRSHNGSFSTWRFGRGPFTQFGEERALTCPECQTGIYSAPMSGFFDVDRDHPNSFAHAVCAITGKGCQF